MADSAARDQDDAVTEEPAERDKTLNIHQRIFGVIGAVKGAIACDAKFWNKAQTKVLYEYVSHDAVTDHIRDAEIQYGILTYPTVDECKNSGNRVELTVRVVFCNVDKPDDKLEVIMAGYGADDSDKGPGKALSYACKMAQLKVYKLQASDDMEAWDVAHDPDKPRASQEIAARDDARAAMEASARNLKAAIDSAGTVDEIDDLQAANKDFLMSAPEVTRGFFVGLIEHRKHQLENPDAG